jgi:hypothetical protein
MCCSVHLSFLAIPYLQLGWVAGHLPMTARSGAPVSLLG